MQKQAEEKTKEINAAYREVIKHLKEQKAYKSSEQNNESSKKEDGGLYNFGLSFIVPFIGDILGIFSAFGEKIPKRHGYTQQKITHKLSFNLYNYLISKGITPIQCTLITIFVILVWFGLIVFINNSTFAL